MKTLLTLLLILTGATASFANQMSLEQRLRLIPGVVEVNQWEKVPDHFTSYSSKIYLLFFCVIAVCDSVPELLLCDCCLHAPLRCVCLFIVLN